MFINMAILVSTKAILAVVLILTVLIFSSGSGLQRTGPVGMYQLQDIKDQLALEALYGTKGKHIFELVNT